MFIYLKYLLSMIYNLKIVPSESPIFHRDSDGSVASLERVTTQSPVKTETLLKLLMIYNLKTQTHWPQKPRQNWFPIGGIERFVIDVHDIDILEFLPFHALFV